MTPDEEVDEWYRAVLGPAGQPPSLHAVNHRARQVAGVLYLAAGADHTAAPGLAGVASALYVSQRSAANYLGELEAAGWIARTGRPGRRTAYRLTWPQPVLAATLARTADDLT